MARDSFRSHRPQKRTYGRNHRSQSSQNFLSSLISASHNGRVEKNAEEHPASPPTKQKASVSSSALAFTPRTVLSNLPKKSQSSSGRTLLTPEEARNKHRGPIRLSQNKFEFKADVSPDRNPRRSTASVKKNKKMRALTKIRPENARHKPLSNEGGSSGWQSFAVGNAKHFGLKPPVLKPISLNKPAPTKMNLSPSSIVFAAPPAPQTETIARIVPKLRFRARPEYASPIERLPDHILLKICVMVFDLTDQVSPFYQQGMLAYGILSDPEDDRGVVHGSNIDASLLRASRTLHEFGSAAIYKLPRFVFSDPHVFSWWLSNIGPNFKLVKDLKLTIGSGWRGSPDASSEHQPLWVRCKEEKWHGLISKVTKNHDLSRLELVLLDEHNTDQQQGTRWEMKNKLLYAEQDRLKLVTWRQKLISLIEKCLRGIETCKIQDISGRWCKRAIAHSLEKLVSQSRDNAAEHLLAQKMNLAEALDDARRRGKRQTAITDEEMEELEESACKARICNSEER